MMVTSPLIAVGSNKRKYCAKIWLGRREKLKQKLSTMEMNDGDIRK